MTRKVELVLHKLPRIGICRNGSAASARLAADERRRQHIDMTYDNLCRGQSRCSSEQRAELRHTRIHQGEMEQLMAISRLRKGCNQSTLTLEDVVRSRLTLAESSCLFPSGNRKTSRAQGPGSKLESLMGPGCHYATNSWHAMPASNSTLGHPRHASDKVTGSARGLGHHTDLRHGRTSINSGHCRGY